MFSLLRRKPKITEEAYKAKLETRSMDYDGHYVPDPVPVAPPVGYKKQPTMVELIRDMVRNEKIKQELEAAGHETFEESEDFDVGDEPDDLRSGWENDHDPGLDTLLQAGREAQEASQSGGAGAPPAPSPAPQAPTPSPAPAPQPAPTPQV